MFTKDFAKDVFKGERKLLKFRDVKWISVNRFDELSVKGLYADFIKMDGMAQYFPKSYPKGR